MIYYLYATVSQMGFWITWLLIPIVVEFFPAFINFFKLLFLSREVAKVTEPDMWPYISVIIPVYNSQETLYGCIESVHDSNYPKERIQVIVADNQSVDNSFTVFQKAQESFHDLNMQWIRTDKGKARALNSAIYSSNGSYILNIDSDGILEKNALKNMIRKFESDKSISAMTGSILIQKDLIKQTKGFFLRVLRHIEYFEYAQAFISGRSIESQKNQLYTMAGAFSGFRREVLVETFMYDFDIVGEDIDMTFQIRERLNGKVVLCVDALYFVDPIEGGRKLYTQRQRWQRGQIEVAQKTVEDSFKMRSLFSDFLIRRMIIDHTFAFLKMIWMFATFSLLFLNYSWILLGLSYLSMYLLYVVMSLFVFIDVQVLLKPFKEEQKFYRRLVWCTFLMPIYTFIISWFRLVSMINTIYYPAQWNAKDYAQEYNDIKKIVREDVQKIRKRGDSYE